MRVLTSSQIELLQWSSEGFLQQNPSEDEFLDGSYLDDATVLTELGLAEFLCAESVDFEWDELHITKRGKRELELQMASKAVLR